MVLAASTDTWGLSGPGFLVIYLFLAALFLAVMLGARPLIAWRRRPGSDAPDLRSAPIDAAYLNGGRRLAMLAACGALNAARAFHGQPGRRVLAAGALPAGLPRLCTLMHQEAPQPIRLRELTRRPAVDAELRTIADRLIHAGLLLTPARVRAQRLLGLLLAALFALGVVRFVVGASNGKPVGFLLALLIGTMMVELWYQLKVRRATSVGAKALDRLRSDNQALSPQQRPSWSSYGPADAALSVGAFGLAAMWAADPTFARMLGLTQSSTGSGGGAGGGCGGGGGGGCGG